MPTNITAQTPPTGSYPTLPLSAGMADIAWTHGTDVGNSYVTPLINNKTIVLARNTDSAAHTITITSAADAQNRKGDITAYSLAAGKVAMFGPFASAGWAQTGNLAFSVSDPTLELAVFTLP